MASQVDRVLALLRARGKEGVHTFELRGAFIGNPSERVRDLIKQGYRIDTSPRESFRGSAKGVRYFLVGEPVEQATASEPKDPPIAEQAGPGFRSLSASHPSEGVRPAPSPAEPAGLFPREDSYKDAVA